MEPGSELIYALSAAGLAGLIAYALSILFIRGGFGLDPVSERSNHHVPTPRLGGVAVLLGAGAGAAALYAAALLPMPALVLLGLTVAAGGIGIIDDLLTLPPSAKFALILALVSAAVGLLGPLEALPVPALGWIGIHPAAGYLIAAFWLLSIVNVVNFMDGLNGLVGSFAVVGLAAAAMVITDLSPLLLAVQAALLGFLLCNVFRGRIFLGDAGSLSLGFLLGAAPLAGEAAPQSFWLMPLVVLPLIADTALTLVRRAARGARLSEPHREHIYQRLKAYGWSHQAVALAVFASGATALGVTFSLRAMCRESSLVYWLTALFIALFWGALMAAMLALKTRRTDLRGTLH